MVTRIKETIKIKEVIIAKPILFVSSIGYEQSIVRRICILMLKCEGLIKIRQGGNVFSMFETVE